MGIDGLPGKWEGVDRVKRGQFAASYVYPTQGEEDYGIGNEHPSG